MTPPWQQEQIPDDEDLYMRVHQVHWKDGGPRPGCFKDMPDRGDGMSTDWSRYRSPEATRLGNGHKDPANYGVVALNVGAIRAIPYQTGGERQRVVHDPLPDNRARTLVHGHKPARIRLEYLRITRVVIHLSQHVQR